MRLTRRASLEWIARRRRMEGSILEAPGQLPLPRCVEKIRIGGEDVHLGYLCFMACLSGKR